MFTQFPSVRVGEPTLCNGVSVFPLFTETHSSLDYRLASEALADQTVVVREVSESGSVPELLVDNKGDFQVLFLEGEELVGAKQNRVLNTSVLVAARSTLKVPVSCVERGRWHRSTPVFRSSGSHAPRELRRELKGSVSRSVRERRGHSSDQRAVWKAVFTLNAMCDSKSPTDALSDAFETYRDRVEAVQAQLRYVAGATGVAVAVGSTVVAVDVFDKPDTCEKLWPRLVSGFAFDACRLEQPAQTATTVDVNQFVAATHELAWQEAPAVGVGEDCRAETPRGDCASLLVLDQTVVHASVVAAV